MSSSPLHDADVDATETANKRRSGRVSRKPDLFAATPASSKRKRDAGEDDGEQDVDGEEPAEDGAEDESPSEGEPDEEEQREKRARARKGKTTQATKPAAKRPKPNGTTVALPLRAAQSKARRPKKAKALNADAAEEAGGLYAEVFARGNTLEEVTDAWLKRFEQEESASVAEVVNFVLRCAGCDLEVANHDIEDPDSCTSKVEDLQGEYQAYQERERISDYPIISKGKGTAAFKESITGFFNTLTKAIHTSGLLFTQGELLENIEVWVSTMSAAQNRPFRHTATLISLSIITALCEIGSELVEGAAKSLRHSESQKKKSKVNKGRVSGLQEEAKVAKQHQEMLDALVKDWFDTVYIHRYRDVDPHIRVDCVKALGDWIITYPDVFFDGSHLRYLGWVLSDPNHTTRHEVIKQLHRLYQDKDKLGGLKTFTERFRARMVEMATRDAEASVRAAAVELLDLLREGGLLEPDDIDAVGRLVFDTEPRVRKAVVGFFAESIKDAYDAKVETLGGDETLEELIGEDDESYDSPRTSWIKLKCLAEGLESYDSADGDLPQHIEHAPGQDNLQLHAGAAESRFMVAAETLYEQLPEVREWEALAGYLLYDTSAEQNGATNDEQAQLKDELRLTEKEELILLEVLNSSVKGTIVHLVQDNAKKTKKQRDAIQDEQEQAARHLANLIPRLLRKFGESPQTATAILRLERVVNLEAFQDFRQDPSTYGELLDDINKQFLSHGNEEVLAEASRALLRAKNYDELGDTTDAKIDALWDDTINTFATLTRRKDIQVRGSIPANVLDAIAKTVLRLEKLASISKPIQYLETIPTIASSTKSNSKSQAPDLIPPLASLILLLQHSIFFSKVRDSQEESLMEDTMVMHASRTILFYFMWRIPLLVESLQTTTGISDDDLDYLARQRDAYIIALNAILESRPANDELCAAIAGMLLDVHTVMAALRRAPTTQHGDDFLALAIEMPQDVQKRVLRVFSAAESAFAKASGRVLDTASATQDTIPSDDEDADPAADPITQDPEDADASSSSEDEAGEADDTQASQLKRSQKLQRTLLAEQRLCELAAKLVLAVLGGMVDASIVPKRLERNKAKLGKNFAEVLNHLDASSGAKGAKKGVQAKGKKAVTAAKAKGKAKSREVVVEDEESEEEDEDVRRERNIAEEEEMEERDDIEEAEDVEAEPEEVLGD